MRLFKIEGNFDGIVCRLCSKKIIDSGAMYELGQGIDCVQCLIKIVDKSLSNAKQMLEEQLQQASILKELVRDHPVEGLEI